MIDDFSNGFVRYVKERSSKQLREATLLCYRNATLNLVHKAGLDLERLADLEHIRSVLEKAEQRKLSSQKLEPLHLRHSVVDGIQGSPDL